MCVPPQQWLPSVLIQECFCCFVVMLLESWYRGLSLFIDKLQIKETLFAGYLKDKLK